MFKLGWVGFTTSSGQLHPAAPAQTAHGMSSHITLIISEQRLNIVLESAACNTHRILLTMRATCCIVFCSGLGSIASHEIGAGEVSQVYQYQIIDAVFAFVPVW
jgi:hypothetical protein